MSNKIQVIKDRSGNNVLPITHEKAVRDSNGVSLETKLNSLESKTYVEAWDGVSTPVVANIPAGVTVTYSGTTYTGTLAASASTDGKVYLVKNGTEYDRYFSSLNLAGNYVWSNLGTTGMDLSDYATEEELSQLQQEVTADISQLGQYEESPEYVEVHTDSEGRVLYGVKQDGDFHFGAGVPLQIDAAINEKLEEGLETKVDKKEGKSLIDADYAASKSAVENPEYLDVKTDSDGKVIEGTKSDGTKEFHGNVKIYGDVNIIGRQKVLGVDYSVISNQEYIAAWVDKSGNVLFGFKTNGRTFIGDAVFLEELAAIKHFLHSSGVENVDYTALLSFSAGENPEWLSVELDSMGKILSGTKSDGSHYSYNLKSETIPTQFSETTDPEERSELTLDKNEKVVSYRRKDGTIVECVGIESPNVSTDKLSLSPSGMSDFQQALKDSGFNPGGAGDWSDAKSIEIPIPRCAVVNITSPNGNAEWPQSKTADLHYYMEFWDMNGNYFKKEIIFNAQGRSSMRNPKKNGAADFCNNNGWDDDDTFKIKFGDWVPQDSFHFKGYYTDFFRGVNVAAYSLINMIWKSRGLREDRPWKKQLIDFTTIGRDYTKPGDYDDMSLQMDNGARCIPDGFPAVFFLNGDFYGIYSWQLKKHRDNYHMSKSNVKHIHLDGVINWNVLWGANGNTNNINWNPGEYQGFEVRNPKDLWTISGKKYDADASTSQELVDTATATSWINSGVLPDGTQITSKISKQLQNTGKVKTNILAFSSVIPTLQSMRDGGSTTTQIKEFFEQHFDPENIIDYIIFSAMIYNYDGFNGNWQWTTWDGVKWFICPYDCDSILGINESGNYIMNSSAMVFENNFNSPIGWIMEYYKTDIESRWNAIKQLGCVEFFINFLNDWMSRIGQENYEKEWAKWPDSPSNRDSNVNTQYWEFAGVRDTAGSQSVTGMIYDETKQYSEYDGQETAGNTCWQFLGLFYYKFRCVQACQGESPMDLSKSPLGFHDSIWRAQNTINYLYDGVENALGI